MTLAASLHGYLLAELKLWQRCVLFVAALLLIAPELISSLIGIVLLCAIGGMQLAQRRSAQAGTGSAGS